MSAVLLAALILSQMSTAAQTVDIVPDAALLRAPFSSQDEERFRKPDKIFYPETWFHFIGGNVSKEGIDADLQAIHDAGLSGIQWFHGYFGGPWPATGHQLTTLSPEWEDMVGYLGRKADSLGLRLTVQTCPGWSMAGGPWITPENAMREIVWTRTDVPAGNKFSSLLEKAVSPDEPWRDYHDIAVLAFPTPLGDTGTPLQPSVIEAADDSWKALVEGRDGKGLSLKEASSNTVTFTLPEGSVVRTLELPPVGAFSHNFCYDPGIHVKLTAKTASGEEKTLVDADLPMSNWQDGNPYDMVFACNEVEDAKTYSFTLTNAHPATVRFVRFLSAARKNSWRGEAGWTLIAKELSQERPEQNPLSYVNSKDIIDITDKMDASGRLDWTAPVGDFPEGKWTVLRIGHVNSGRRNSPAPPEATGWECSKFDPRGAEIQFANYVGMLQDGPLGGKASGMLMDSWECHTQTWTPGMEETFEKSAGYKLRGHLPALMGYVLDGQELTSKFLIDWRRTVNDLYCENFFKKMTDLAHGKGMKVQYETAGGDVVTMDPMEYFKYADVPMCEFWQPFSEGYVGDLDFKPIKPTASAAHIYGKPRVAAESFTSFSLTWDEHWQMLRDVANFNMGEGVTHNVFHTYTHNPQIGFLPPGTSFARNIGTPFLRGQTWWKYMSYFTGFLARQSYLLERGLPVVDVLWYLGDEVGHRPSQYTGNGKRQEGNIRFPDGYKYDYCNPDVLLGRLTVKDGKIVTPEGIAYEVLWIPENERMLPETVAKIRELVLAGAKVVGNAPNDVATLSGGEEMLLRFDDEVISLWGDLEPGRVNRMGKGAIAVSMSLDEALKAFGLRPRLVCEEKDLIWTEREEDGATWFFVASPPQGEFHGTVKVRAKGKAQWWNPVDGTIHDLKARGWGRYRKIHLDLAQAEGGFIVFRKDGAASQGKVSVPGKHEISVTNWSVSFPEGWGAPKEPVRLDALKPWKDLDLGEEGRAFSGTATYSATFNVPSGSVGKDLVLDLGKVDFIADVKINGEQAGVCWTAPYTLRIGDLVHEGENTLTVDVTGTWYNRLVYDAGQDEALRKTWTIAGPAADAPLHDSGLLGPVKVCVGR